MILIFKCGCLSGSNSLNLHFEISFLKKSRPWKNFKIFCPSIQIIVALHVTLKQVTFLHTVFHDANLKSRFEPWDVSKNKANITTQFTRFFFLLRWLVFLIFIYWVGVQRGHLTLCGEGASLVLFDHPSSDGVLIKMLFEVDVFNCPTLHPIFSYWII